MLFQSLVVYSFIIGIMFLCAIVASRKSQYVIRDRMIKLRSFWTFEVVFMIFFFAVMFGIRYDVGRDHLGYLESYLDGSAGDDERNEFLFRSISALCYNMNLHVVVYFGIWALLQITFFLLFFYNERYFFPFLILFLYFDGTFEFWMNGIRQAIAMCVWVYSINFIVERKIWKYLICGFIACLFHRSAVILIVFYPILKNGSDFFKSISLQLIFLAIIFIVRFKFEPFVMNFDSYITWFLGMVGGENAFYKAYTIEAMIGDLTKESSGTGMAFLFKMVVSIMIILYSKKLKAFYNTKKFTIVYFFFFLSLLTYYIFPEGIISLSRPFRYFYIFQSIMLAYFAYYLLRNKSNRMNKLVLYALIIGFIGIFYLSQITSNADSHLWYQFYFQPHL